MSFYAQIYLLNMKMIFFSYLIYVIWADYLNFLALKDETFCSFISFWLKLRLATEPIRIQWFLRFVRIF